MICCVDLSMNQPYTVELVTDGEPSSVENRISKVKFTTKFRLSDYTT